VTDPTGKRVTILKSLLLVIAVVSAVVSSGCTPPAKKGMPAPISHADRIGLFVPPNAIANWDGEPGFDGVIAQVMLFRHKGGGLDVMIYEGAKPDNLSDAIKPFFSWTFNAEELSQRAVGQYGSLWGYALRLPWKLPPRSEKVWLIARYRPPSGRAIYSSPAEQPMPVEVPKPKK
jgi:hypothetical protein